MMKERMQRRKNMNTMRKNYENALKKEQSCLRNVKNIIKNDLNGEEEHLETLD